jgi:hypothetical protein
LGLDQLFKVRVSAIKKDGQALPIPLEEDRTARSALPAGSRTVIAIVLRPSMKELCRKSLRAKS